MATTTQETKIKITADTKAAQKSLNNLDKQFKDINKSSESTGNAFDKLGSKFSKLGVTFGNISSSMTTAFKGVTLAATATVASFTVLAAATNKIAKIADLGDQYSDLETQFIRLSEAAGKVSESFLVDLKKATDGAISNADLFKVANKALTLELDTLGVDVVELADKVKDFADATGKDAKQSLDTFIQAMASGRTTTLAMQGILVDNNKALEDHAKALGKDVKNLTEQEKIAAKALAVQKELTEQVSKLGDTTENAGDAAQTYKAEVSDLIDNFRKGITQSEGLKDAFKGLSDTLKNIDWEEFGRKAGQTISYVISLFDYLVEVTNAFSMVTGLIDPNATVEVKELQKSFMQLRLELANPLTAPEVRTEKLKEFQKLWKEANDEVRKGLEENIKDSERLLEPAETFTDLLSRLGGVATVLNLGDFKELEASSEVLSEMSDKITELMFKSGEFSKQEFFSEDLITAKEAAEVNLQGIRDIYDDLLRTKEKYVERSKLIAEELPKLLEGEMTQEDLDLALWGPKNALIEIEYNLELNEGRLNIAQQRVDEINKKIIEAAKKAGKEAGDSLSGGVGEGTDKSKKEIDRLVESFRKLETQSSLKKTNDQFDKLVDSIEDLNVLNPEVEVLLKANFDKILEDIRENATKAAEEFYSKFDEAIKAGKISAAEVEFLKQEDIEKAVQTAKDTFSGAFKDASTEQAEDLKDKLKEAYQDSVDFWTDIFSDALNGEFDLSNLEDSLKRVAAGFAGSLTASLTGAPAGATNATQLGQILGQQVFGTGGVQIGGTTGGSTGGLGSIGNYAALADSSVLEGDFLSSLFSGGAEGFSLGESMMGPMTQAQSIASDLATTGGTMAAISTNLQNLDNLDTDAGRVEAAAAAAGTALGAVLGGPIGAGIGSIIGDQIGQHLGGLFGEGDPERLLRESTIERIASAIEESTGTRGISTTEGTRQLDPSAYNVELGVGAVAEQAINLVSGLGDILAEGADKLGDDLTGIFANLVGESATYNEAILNTISLMDSLGYTAQSAKDELRELFLDNQITVEEFAANLQGLNQIDAGLFQPGEGGITEAIEEIASQLSEGNFRTALNSAEILMNEMSEEGLSSFSQLADYLEGRVSPAIVELFDSLEGRGISSFIDITDADANAVFQAVDALNPLVSMYNEVRYAVESGQYALESATESNVANITRQAEATLNLAKAAETATNNFNKMNEAIRNRPTPTVEVEDVGVTA